MLLEVCEHDFDQVVLESTIPVIVDFWAPWCRPCKMMEPLLTEMAEKYKDILFVKVNVEEQGILAQDFEINIIPCFISFKSGQVHKIMLGVGTEKQLLELLN
jgi:thioredoxin